MKAEEIFDNATMAFVVGNNEEAIRLYCEAANLGYLDAIKLLADTYEKGDKLDVEQDDIKALSYYKQAVLLNDLDSFNNILNYPLCDERIKTIKELLRNSTSLLASPVISQKIEKLLENEIEFSSDTNLVLALSSIKPFFSKYIKFENLSSEQLKEMLIAKPEFSKNFAYWDKFTISDIEEIAEKNTSILLNYPNLNNLNTNIWVKIISFDSRLFELCPESLIGNFDSKDWFNILSKHSELAPKCVWEKLDRIELCQLIDLKPEVFSCCYCWQNIDLGMRQLIKSRNPKVTDKFIDYFDQLLKLKEFENIDYEKYGNLEFILCLPGTFTMGSNLNEPNRCIDEVPHKVTIAKPFLIAKYPVTQELYKIVMGDNPSANKAGENPVENVSYNNAIKFCTNLTREMANSLPKNFIFSIPTEEQWEYACKAGTEQGNIDLSDYVPDNKTHPVDDGKPNNWNICDMLGNVLEWTRSWYCQDLTKEGRAPSGLGLGKARVCRGASFKEPMSYFRAARRYQFKGGLMKQESPEIGFRVIIESRI